MLEKGEGTRAGGCGGGEVGIASAGDTNGADGDSSQQQQQQQHRPQPTFARVVVTCEMLREVLGPELYESEVAARVAVPGTCTGLAWTPTGGELLFIECTSMPGNGAVKLTGKLGEVCMLVMVRQVVWCPLREQPTVAEMLNTAWGRDKGKTWGERVRK